MTQATSAQATSTQATQAATSNHAASSPAQIWSIKSAAAELQMLPRALVRLAEQGRIPHITRVGSRWVLNWRSMRFLRRYFGPGSRLRGSKGQATAARMRKLARRCDPQCAARQQAYARK